MSKVDFRHHLLLELLGNRLIEPVFFNSLPRTGLSISFWDDLYFVFLPFYIRERRDVQEYYKYSQDTKNI
jgi:hypothetical protein